MESGHFNLSALFALCGLGHLLLLMTQWDIMEDETLSGTVTYPILWLTVSGLIDNARFYAGTLPGTVPPSLFPAHVAFFFRVVLLPVLFATVWHMIGSLTCDWLKYPGSMVSIWLCFHGVNVFASVLHNRLVLDETDGLTHYTYVRSKSSRGIYQLVGPFLLVELFLVLVALLLYARFGEVLSLVLCVPGLVGRLVTAAHDEQSVTLTTALNLLLAANLIRVEKILLEQPL